MIKENDNKKFKTALYVRLSREDGEDKIESNSITNQKQMLQDYISNHNDIFECYNIYSDENFTGTNFNRPAFQQMIQDIKNGYVNCVIVKDLSRFGRDYIEGGRYLERFFPEYNIRFIALTDNIDSFKQAYDMLLPVKNIFNQQYAVDISKKVQSAFKTKQKNGSFIGAFASYGYVKDKNNHNKLIIDEYPAQIIRRIFKMYIDGYGKIKIAKILNEEHIPCPSEYKKQNGLNYTNGQKIGSTTYWTYSTIHRILQNEILIGNMSQGKTLRSMKGKAKILPKEQWITVKNTHEAIIDVDTWNKTQNLLQRNTRQLDFNQNISIFAGYLRCKDCKRALAKNKRGNKTYYICGSYKRYGSSICTPHSVTEEELTEITLAALNLTILKLKMLKQIIKKRQSTKKQNHSKIKIIKKEIEKLTISIDKIYNLKKGIYEDYKEGILTKDEYLQYKSDYEKEEKILKNKIISLKNENENNEENIFENSWIKNLMYYGEIKKLDRNIMVNFIDTIIVGEQKDINIVLNCTEDIVEYLNITCAEK